jgi:hypothetical protein
VRDCDQSHGIRKEGATVDLGDVLWAMLAFFSGFMVIWMFITIFGDNFRHDDVSGWGKAGWIFLIFALPFLRILIYMIARPRMTSRTAGRRRRPSSDSAGYPVYSAAGEVAKLAQLRDAGELSADEYEAMKRQAMVEV